MRESPNFLLDTPNLFCSHRDYHCFANISVLFSPGLTHEVLKSQLKQRIQEKRRRSCQEIEKQLKLYQAEDISDDGGNN